MKLSDLPLEFWSEEVFREIGNSLGSFIQAHLRFHSKRNLSLDKILVDVDLKHGLVTKITLQKGPKSIVQALGTGLLWSPFSLYKMS
jgi:hypothetical protein